MLKAVATPSLALRAKDGSVIAQRYAEVCKGREILAQRNAEVRKGTERENFKNASGIDPAPYVKDFRVAPFQP
jgi:hypothetical protein